MENVNVIEGEGKNIMGKLSNVFVLALFNAKNQNHETNNRSLKLFIDVLKDCLLKFVSQS